MITHCPRAIMVMIERGRGLDMYFSKTEKSETSKYENSLPWKVCLETNGVKFLPKYDSWSS